MTIIKNHFEVFLVPSKKQGNGIIESKVGLCSIKASSHNLSVKCQLWPRFRVRNSIGCLNSKFPPTLHSGLKIQPTTLFGEKCVRLYLLGYLLISVFTTQNFRIKEKNENLF
jgi:hypothetical protein